MRIVFVWILSLIVLSSHAQRWHSIYDTLKYPPHPNGEVSMGWFNHYDTIPIIYHAFTTWEEGVVGFYFGWKRVYVYKGMYVDDSTTIGKFWDKRWQPAKSIYRYAFN